MADALRRLRERLGWWILGTTEEQVTLELRMAAHSLQAQINRECGARGVAAVCGASEERVRAACAAVMRAAWKDYKPWLPYDDADDYYSKSAAQ